MDYLYLVLILIIIVLCLWVWKLRNEKRESEKEVLALEKERDEFASFGNGLEEYNKKMQERKEQAKEKIMGLFKDKEKISNSDIVKALDISKNSAIRYLDELEVENKVKQVGKTGQAVFYTKI